MLSSAAALLDELFEHPAQDSPIAPDRQMFIVHNNITEPGEGDVQTCPYRRPLPADRGCTEPVSEGLAMAPILLNALGSMRAGGGITST